VATPTNQSIQIKHNNEKSPADAARIFYDVRQEMTIYKEVSHNATSNFRLKLKTDETTPPLIIYKAITHK
jgi:hypothetical protein